MEENTEVAHYENPELMEPEAILTGDELVDAAAEKILDIFRDKLSSAMFEVGTLIFEQFFDGDIEKARIKESTKGESFNKLIEHFETYYSGKSPSRTWLYNSLKLIVVEHDMKGVQTYVQLPQSYKVALLRLKDLKLKKMLSDEASSGRFHARDLSDRISEVVNSTRTIDDAGKNIHRLLNQPKELLKRTSDEILPDETLKNYTEKKLISLKDILEEKIKLSEDVINTHKKLLERYNGVKVKANSAVILPKIISNKKKAK